MLLAIALLLQAPSGEPAHVEWLARPDARAVAECLSGSPAAVVVTLQCRTAPKDKLDGCTATATPAHAGAEKTALCMARKMRARATDAGGAPLIGAPVTTSLNIGTR